MAAESSETRLLMRLEITLVPVPESVEVNQSYVGDEMRKNSQMESTRRGEVRVGDAKQTHCRHEFSKLTHGAIVFDFEAVTLTKLLEDLGLVRLCVLVYLAGTDTPESPVNAYPSSFT